MLSNATFSTKSIIIKNPTIHLYMYFSFCIFCVTTNPILKIISLNYSREHKKLNYSRVTWAVFPEPRVQYVTSRTSSSLALQTMLAINRVSPISCHLYSRLVPGTVLKIFIVRSTISLGPICDIMDLISGVESQPPWRAAFAGRRDRGCGSRGRTRQRERHRYQAAVHAARLYHKRYYWAAISTTANCGSGAGSGAARTDPFKMPPNCSSEQMFSRTDSYKKYATCLATPLSPIAVVENVSSQNLLTCLECFWDK